MLVIAFLAFRHGNDYLREKWVDVTLLQEYEHESHHKSSTRVNPVFVLELDNGYIFDIPVSYSTAYKYKVGDRFKMYLSNMDIKQTYFDNTIFFFGYIIVFALMISHIIATIGMFIFEKNATVRIFDDK